MAVYNGEKYITAAIKSVLNQTFGNFEFIIMDDGSTDGTLGIINSFKNKRILLIKNKHNYINTLNTGLEKASGKYIARMDADDIMHIDRLSIQYAIMEKNPDIDICASWMHYFDETGNERVWSTLSGYIDNPLLHLLKTCFILNPTSMIRKSLIDKFSLRYKDYHYAEDFKFWSEAAKHNACFYIDSQLVHYYKISNNQNSSLHRKEQIDSTFKIQKEIIARLIEEQKEESAAFHKLYADALSLQESGKMENNLFLDFFYKLFSDNNR